MKTKGQRNLKLLGGQEKTAGRPDGQADSSIPPLQLFLCGGITRTISKCCSYTTIIFQEICV
jgi:hypothetical protein